ncbi:uncharacterized protein B0H18DRAFT_1130752 [Fomitopsis serialis]|uniref:uncharacterized protein n=1 Tax=Fomitopsis serialis TaxID=139415 RepID=UPI0020082EC2|nr:uncharacterized protein B0H18DRAFT_1130752 [Neoantrodia serialis]KAH9910146.1 hypothetical protein B0H18DRAFT_1130752 [Neoantrodia serialis]
MRYSGNEEGEGSQAPPPEDGSLATSGARDDRLRRSTQQSRSNEHVEMSPRSPASSAGKERSSPSTVVPAIQSVAVYAKLPQPTGAKVRLFQHVGVYLRRSGRFQTREDDAPGSGTNVSRCEGEPARAVDVDEDEDDGPYVVVQRMMVRRLHL